MANEHTASSDRRKVALIIANGNYRRSNNKLDHSATNAKDLRRLLRSIDFALVDTHVDVQRDEEMNVILRKFAKKIEEGDLVVFYFFGHASRVEATNYLIPTDDKPIKTEQDVPDFSVNAQHAFDLLTEKNQSYATIFIVDCSTPYRLDSPSTSDRKEARCFPSMTVMDSSAGPSIQFIAAANQTDDHAPTSHSANLFTKYLLAHLAEANVTVPEIFQRVQDLVERESNQTQRAMIGNQLHEHRDVCINPVNTSKPNIPPDAKWKSKARTVIGGRGTGDSLDRIGCPQGLRITQKQTIFVADSANHRIMEYQPNAVAGRRMTGRNINDGSVNRLDRPSDMLYDVQSKALILCDRGNYRVLWRHLQNNTYRRVIPESTACFGLAMDEEGALYVSDIERHEVRRYPAGSKRGTVVAGGHGQGRRLTQLNQPTYIAVGPDQSVYVSDSMNDRVVKWGKDAEKGIVVAGGCGKGKDLTQLYCPAGLIMDGSGTIYVADHWNDRVMRWREGATKGEVIAGDKYRGGNSANELNGPQGIAFDRDGNLYVADCYNHRIQCFAIEKD